MIISGVSLMVQSAIRQEGWTPLVGAKPVLSVEKMKCFIGVTEPMMLLMAKQNPHCS